MKTVPMGRMNTAMAFSAPVVVAALAERPRWATMSASLTPMTTWLARETTSGQASLRSVGSVGAARDEGGEAGCMEGRVYSVGDGSPAPVRSRMD
jgi:hypothetical protein